MKNKELLISVVLILVIIIGICIYTYNKNDVNNSYEITDIDDSLKVNTSESKDNKVEEENKKDDNSKGEEGVALVNKYYYGNYTINESNKSVERIGFWFGRNKEGKRPNGPMTEQEFKEYNSYYIGNNKKVIYLTFDEGISTTEAMKNMDTLKKYNIKATFFVTKGFIKAKPDVVRRMVKEGHVVGNHTVSHLDMSTLAKDDPTKFIQELAETEKEFKEVTGEDMKKVFRFPEGAFSARALDYTNQMGYRSVFWSFAYKDWEADINTKDQSLEWMKSYYHPGAIYLLHGVSKGNSAALEDFILFMKEQGYDFDLVTNI